MKKYVIKRDRSGLPEKLTRYREELNAEQFRVVTAPPKASLVVAGAGTGKTRTITYRVAYLIEQGVSPQNQIGDAMKCSAPNFVDVLRAG